MAEYIPDYGYGETKGESGEDKRPLPEPVEGEERVGEEHLLIMHLLYARATGKGGGYIPGVREGYASLDTLREVSGLLARRVWEVVEELQELDLVDCVWDSRSLKSLSSTRGSGETSGELRFLRGTQASLTNKGLSYPPLLEYRRLRLNRRWENPSPQKEHVDHRQSMPRPQRQPMRKLHIMQQPSQGYHLYRPREQAARRLAYLACALCVVLLATVVLVALALT